MGRLSLDGWEGWRGGGAAEAEGRGGLRGLAGASSSSLSGAFGSSDGLSQLLREDLFSAHASNTFGILSHGLCRVPRSARV